MNRHYTPEEYRERCGILREAFENPAITTDVIAGFPGETRAAGMEGQVPEPVKAQRSNELLALGGRLSGAYRRSFLGREEEVLLEEETALNGKAYMAGHTRQYVKAAVPYRLQAVFREAFFVSEAQRKSQKTRNHLAEIGIDKGKDI